jgi:phosphotransferase system  glucose/maltose/N-acetylglucosamine-specific IIC component
LNPKWTIFVEVTVVVHALLVALMNSHNWPMFLFGFLGVFMVTQMYGLPLSQKMRWLLWSLFIGLIIAVYNFKGWDFIKKLLFLKKTN